MNKKQLFENYLNENIDNAYRFAYTYTKSKEDAEDVVSESVIKALKALHRLRNTESLKPWFYKIIANTALSHIKKNQKLIPSEPETFEAAGGKTDDYSVLNFESLIKSLDIKYRSIIVMRFLEDMSLKEIAKVLDTNENTVKTRLYTALKMLRMEVYDE